MDELEALLPVVLPVYCERDVSGAEPLTVSNASFWLAAAIGWPRWRTRRTRLVTFALVMLFAVGACSALWHWFRRPLLLPLDAIPLYVLVVGVAYAGLSELASRRYALAAIVLVLAGAIAANALSVGTPVHVVSRHGAALLVLAAAVAPLYGRDPRAWAWIAGALGLYALALAGKLLDAPHCDAVPIGFHWLWHGAGGAAAGAAVHGAWLASREERPPARVSVERPTRR